MALKPTKSLTVELNPLVLLKDWLEEQSEMFCALQPAMPRDGHYTTLSVGVLQKWIGFVILLGDGSLKAYTFSDYSKHESVEKGVFDIHDPTSFPVILEIMHSNKEVKR